MAGLATVPAATTSMHIQAARDLRDAHVAPVVDHAFLLFQPPDDGTNIGSKSVRPQSADGLVREILEVRNHGNISYR